MDPVTLEIKRAAYSQGKRLESPTGYSPLEFKSGVFESFLVRRNLPGQRIVLNLTHHLDRLAAGCARSDINLSSRESLVAELMSAVNDSLWSLCENLRARVIAAKDSLIITLEESLPPKDEVSGISILVVPSERPLPEIKSCPAIVSATANEEALRAGCDEALLVDTSGVVREGAWSNFFWFDTDGRLVTPSAGMLPGVTRKEVIRLSDGVYPIAEENHSLNTILKLATEAFVTSALRGVVPVIRINGHSLSGGRPGERTIMLRRAYLNSSAYETID